MLFLILNVSPLCVSICHSLLCDWLLPPNRSLLLAELEKEEKEKDWYYAQLQNLTKRIDSLPLTENVNNLTGRILLTVYRHRNKKPSLIQRKS